jgi:hypothetical protein
MSWIFVSSQKVYQVTEKNDFFSGKFAYINSQLPQPKLRGGYLHLNPMSHLINQYANIWGCQFSEELFSGHRPTPKNPNTTKDSPSKTRRGSIF